VIKIKEDTKIMAELLHSGYTMLDKACPICNNPIFRNKEGVMFCPICNKKVMIVKDEIRNSNNDSKKKPKNMQQLESIASLKDIIFDKIEMISQKLKDETQIDLIEKYIRLLLEFHDILNKFGFI